MFYTPEEQVEYYSYYLISKLKPGAKFETVLLRQLFLHFIAIFFSLHSNRTNRITAFIACHFESN